MVQDAREVDVLWLVEHAARELDAACAVACLARERWGLEVLVRHIYLHAEENLASLRPRVIAHPFVYFVQGALATEDYVRAWPRAPHFNLAWEELFYPGLGETKAPGDAFTRERVRHHAWSREYRDFLLERGVRAEHIFLNGNPALQLYQRPYRAFFRDRRELARAHGLDPEARWVFIPENYRWAFTGDQRIAWLADQGGDAAELRRMRDYCTRSLELLFKWCARAARQTGAEIIFRPRPATNSRAMQDFMERALDGGAPPGLHLIKDASTRDWILAGDVVLSSFSTSLIEAAAAGKPAFMVEPLPPPPSLHCPWHDLVGRLTGADDFLAVCRRNGAREDRRLEAWARETMLSRGDPIGGLADILAGLVREAPPAEAAAPRESEEAKAYFNAFTHECDVFDDQEAADRMRAWRAALRLPDPDQGRTGP